MTIFIYFLLGVLSIVLLGAAVAFLSLVIPLVYGAYIGMKEAIK